MKIQSFKISLLIIFLLNMISCKVNYSFSGADIDSDLKTFSVDYFDNVSGNGLANISDLFTNALRDKIQKQTNLTLVNHNGDIQFKGKINQYYYTVQAPTGTETSDLRRITMKLEVDFKNSLTPDDAWNQSFQSYAEHSVDINLNTIEEESVNIINALLVDEIFNKAFVKW